MASHNDEDGHAAAVTLFRRAVDSGALFWGSSVRTEDCGPDYKDDSSSPLQGPLSMMALAPNQWNTLHDLHRVMKTIEGQVEAVKAIAPEYDPEIGVKSNGYRSFVKISGLASDRALTVLKQICPDLEKLLQGQPQESEEAPVEVQDHGNIHDNNNDYDDQQHKVWSYAHDGKVTIFKGLRLKLQVRGDYWKAWEEMAYWAEYLKKLSRLLGLVLEVSQNNKPGELMPSIPNILEHPLLQHMYELMVHEDLAIFYDHRGLGLFLKDSVRLLVNQALLLQGLFADVYHGPILGRVARLMRNYFGFRYWLDRTALGEAVYRNAKDSPVGFCKDFFGFSEYEVCAKFMNIGVQPVRTNHLIRLEADEGIQVQTSDACGSILVPPPTSHFGKRPFNVRLISPFRANRMVVGSRCARCLFVCWCHQENQQDKPCRSIMFHVHGGGFISQTSKSHESYLRDWAAKLGIPILSVDYSLSPEGSYPRPVEETLYAYAWMRNNFLLLGTTGENVILAGDSAGGNLVAGLVINCIRLRIPVASSMALFYPSLFLQVFPSPSRLITFIDPFLMPAYLVRCINAYMLGTRASQTRSFDDELQDGFISNHDPVASPLMADDDLLSKFPLTYIFSTDVDMCLDECVIFANKLKRVNVPVNLEVYKSIPHGFLSLNLMSKDCQAALDNVTEHLTDLLSL